MRVRVSDPTLTRDLIRFLRRHDYLAIEEEEPEFIEAVPINSVSARADRNRLRRHLDEWQAEHPGVMAEPLLSPNG